MNDVKIERIARDPYGQSVRALPGHEAHGRKSSLTPLFQRGEAGARGWQGYLGWAAPTFQVTRYSFWWALPTLQLLRMSPFPTQAISVDQQKLLGPYSAPCESEHAHQEKQGVGYGRDTVPDTWVCLTPCCVPDRGWSVRVNPSMMRPES